MSEMEHRFRQGYSVACSPFKLNDMPCQLVKYAVPARVCFKSNEIQRYLEALDSPSIPDSRKRIKTSLDQADLAVSTLEQVVRARELGRTLVAGSTHICGIAWATFGKGTDIPARNHFSDLKALYYHYKPEFGTNYSELLAYHFVRKRARKTLERLEKMSGFTITAIISVAFYVLHDLLRHCGPDCLDFLEFASNDLDVTTPEDVDVEQWKKAHGKVVHNTNDTLNLPAVSRYGWGSSSNHLLYGKSRSKVSFRIKTGNLAKDCYGWKLKDVYPIKEDKAKAPKVATTYAEKDAIYESFGEEGWDKNLEEQWNIG